MDDKIMDEPRKMRVWWVPQIGSGESEKFFIPVESVEEAKKYMDVLAAYDAFQYNHDIKPDYCNAGGLEVWDDDENSWCDWTYDDGDCFFNDVDEYIESRSDAPKFDEFSKELFGQVTFG
jgi:hypothetical protein